MGSHTRPDSAREAARQPDGKFGAQPLSGSDSVDLNDPIRPGWYDALPAHLQATYDRDGYLYIRDGRGRRIELEPGELGPNADYVFTHGQCLAFAVAFAERIDGKVYVSRFGPDDSSAETSDGELNDIKHAYAMGPDGTLYDIRGENDPVIVAEEEIDFGLTSPVVFDKPRDALLRFEPFMARQEVEVASSYVDAVLSETNLGGSEQGRRSDFPVGSPAAGVAAFRSRAPCTWIEDGPAGGASYVLHDGSYGTVHPDPEPTGMWFVDITRANGEYDDGGFFDDRETAKRVMRNCLEGR